MNNKKGGFGVTLVIILILMLAAAAGGAYGYRVLDGKLAARDAQKTIDAVKLSAYDTQEASQIQIYIEDAKEALESITTCKDVYEIMTTFNDNISKLPTKTEKELEAARKAAEEANSQSNEPIVNSPSDANNTGNGSETSNGSGGLFNGLFGNGSSNSDSNTNSEGDIFN